MNIYRFFLLGLCFLFASINADASLQNDTIIDGKTIQEVTVTGREIVNTTDKTIINVGANVKKFSHDGYSALSLLTIPGLNVDPIDETVKSHGAETVLCINGLPASKDEVKTLNPKDLKRIDYYSNFHPEFPTAEGGVIDFIVRVRDNGGMVMAQANENLNRWTGSDMADWKFYSRKSEFGVQLSGDYNHFTPSSGPQSTTQMAFAGGDVTKSVFTNPSAAHKNGIKGQLSYMHRFDSGTLKMAVSLKNGHNANHKNTSQRIEALETIDVESRDYTHSDNTTPAFSVQYRNVFKNKATLSIGMSGDYTDTKQQREYSAIDTYQSDTKEKYYRLKPSINATYPVTKRYFTHLGVNYYYDKSEISYKENGVPSLSTLMNGQLHVVFSNAFKVVPNIFHVTLQTEARVMTVDDGDRYTHSFFTPNIFYNVKLPHGNTIRGSVGMGAFTPNMKYYNTIEKRVDEYQVIVGNADQKIDYGTSAEISFSSSHKWGLFELFGKYENNRRPLYEDVVCDNDRNVYIHTFRNGGRFEKWIVNAAMVLNLIPKKLKWMFAGEYDYSKGHFDMKKDYGRMVYGSELVYVNRGFQGKVSFNSKLKSYSKLGYLETHPASLKVALGYTINNLHLNFYATNPFMKTPRENSLVIGGYSNATKYYSPRVDYNVFMLRATYRFTYGKKHKYEDVNTEDEHRSAILY